jgi:TRAP-type C4-dicarboxylate transport system substrate-binding protein
MAAPVSGSIQGAVPLIEILHMPFLYENLDMVTKTWYGYPGEIIKKEMEKMGVKFLAEGYFGHAVISNSKREIKTLNDLKGLKIRTAGPMDADVVKILGASPVVIAGDEAYLAMSRKTVDGSFTGTPAMSARKYWEVQKYVSMVPLTYTSISMLINLNFWNGLPKDTRDLLQQCAKESEEMVLNLTLQDLKDSVEILKKNGMIVYFPTPSELEEFRKATQPIIDDWVNKHGDIAAKMVEFVRNLK